MSFYCIITFIVHMYTCMWFSFWLIGYCNTVICTGILQVHVQVYIPAFYSWCGYLSNSYLHASTFKHKTLSLVLIDKTEEVLAVMRGFSLPTTNIPTWAATVPEDDWRTKLFMKLHGKSSPSTSDSDNNTKISDSNSCGDNTWNLS